MYADVVHFEMTNIKLPGLTFNNRKYSMSKQDNKFCTFINQKDPFT